MKLIYLTVVLVGFFSGCRYSRVTIPQRIDLGTQLSLSADEKQKLSYALLNQTVLMPKCVSCHGSSGNVNLESYETVVDALTKVKESVFITQSMPKKTFLSDYEKRLLWNWIEMGAPLQAQNPVDEPPQLEPIQPNYDSINAHVFIPKCLVCHSEGHSGERVLLTKSELLDSPLELVLPNNPDESGLVIAVERADKKRMPPEKEGYAALKDDEKAAIRKWIDDGAL